MNKSCKESITKDVELEKFYKNSYLFENFKKFQDLLENFHPRSNYLFELYKHFFLLFLLQVNSSKAFFSKVYGWLRFLTS